MEERGDGAQSTNSLKSSSTTRWKVELRALGELLALAGLAITQPILDVFGRAPDHLIFRGAGRTEIIVFGLVTAFAVPVTIWLIELAAGAVSARARTSLHTGAIGTLAAITVTLLTDSLLPRFAAVLIGIAAATGFVVAHRRTRGPRIWLAFLSPAPIGFLALFLLASPVAPLLQNPADALDIEVRNPARTIIVLFDQLPLSTLLDEDGLIDADLFPNFGQLADTSHWFRQTTTIGNLTKLVIPALLTGNEARGGPAVSANYPDNLFTLIGGAMPVSSSETMTRMCPDSLCEAIDPVPGGLRTLFGDAGRTLGQRLDPRDPEILPITDLHDADTADPTPDDEGEDDDVIVLESGVILRPRRPDGGLARMERFLDTIGDEPGLHFLHLVLPHHPYVLLPDGTRYGSESPQIGSRFGGWRPEPEPVELVFERYLLQLQRSDALLGQVIDHLQSNDLWDDSNLIVLSDHGFAYEPGSTFRGWTLDATQNDTSIAEILWVPFFIKAAHQTEGVISDAPVRNIDLTPTIASLLHVDIPWSHTGRSAFGGGSGDDDQVGLLVGEDADRPGVPGPLRTLDRDTGWHLLLDRTAGGFAPKVSGASGSERIHRRGPRPDLWARPTPDGLEPVDVDLTATSRADDVDPTSGELPALFQSTTDAAVGTDVAISVNGTVWATTTVYAYGEDHRIDAMLPAEAFRPGQNDMQVHALSGP